MTIEDFKRHIGHKHPPFISSTVVCYCGARAFGTYWDLTRGGWQWLVSWWGWACPNCRPRGRQ